MRFLGAFLLTCMVSAAVLAMPKPMGFEDHDGSFSAKIALTGMVAVEKYDRPSADAIQKHGLTRVKPGNPVAVHVLFMGMALDEKQFCDVTFDLQLLDPDGVPVTGISATGLQAMKEVITNPANVFNSHDVRAVSFDAADKPGTYTVKVTVHDNVGNKHVTTSAAITLLK